MRLTCTDAVFGAHSVASDDALDPIITPAEITETVGWLCSPGAFSITGATIDVNGGMRMG